MATSLVNIFSQMLSPLQKVQQKAMPVASSTSGNPFANPFLNPASNFYGKNNPIKGGYFAGYYNGKPNIVGAKLFIEV